jgi:TolB-like protein
MEPRAGVKFRFGSFEINLQTGELHKRGRRVRIEAKPFQLLTTLLERRPHLVARQELHKVLWPADIFVNFDQGLNSAIRKLRKALGDSTKNPCFIATQPHRGYRFVGHAIELHEVNQAGAQLVPRIVVLPFRGLGRQEQEYFVDGLTEEVIARLGCLHPQHVNLVAGELATKSKRTRNEIDRIAQELQVDYILTGSVRWVVNRVRVTASLTETSEGIYAWNAVYERETADLLEVQKDIAEKILESLVLTLAPGCVASAAEM